MDVIGQNGNDGEHYDEEDHPVPLTKVARILQKGPSKNRVITDKGEEKWVDKDDNTIRYL